MDLGEAINVCRQEKVLSERTADLCSVVRSYRNLIHPGRMARLQEPPPSFQSGQIALALIDLITDDLAKVLQASVGLTGEQILSKVQRDVHSLTILTHLIAEVKEHQRERLLTELIPNAYMSLLTESRADPLDDRSSETRDRLQHAFRAILKSASRQTRERVASVFVRVLREEDGQYITDYREAFFAGEDLEYLSGAQLAMVKEHLLETVGPIHNPASISRISGIEAFLNKEDVRKWLDPFVRVLVTGATKPLAKEKARNHVLFATLFTTTSEIDDEISKRLGSWVKHFEKDPEKAEVLAKLKKELDDQGVPF
jgi:hypothetical protein